MYKSPIEIIHGQMQTQIEGEVLRAVQSYGINADKEELLRALQYDRDQYYKGYGDAMASIVHCKDCKNNGACSIQDAMNWTPRTEICDAFCSYGERREGD